MFLRAKGTIVVAPLTGKLINLSDVEDPIFSGHVVGDGVAIIPTDGKVIAPISGQVSFIGEFKYSYGIRGFDGVEILVHLGLHTMKMQGRGFTPHVVVGQKVNVGDLLCEMDLDLIKNGGCDITTPIIVNSGKVVANYVKESNGEVMAGTSPCLRYVKDQSQIKVY